MSDAEPSIPIRGGWYRKDVEKDAIARLIAAAIYRPQPHMSGDIWQRLGPLRQRGCEDAAESVLEYLQLSR